MTTKLEEFDYVIVGAGSAGCVLANRLSADKSNKVLLIESGKSDNYFWIPIPVGYLYTIGNPRTDWCYKTEQDKGLNNRSIGYARGKVMGGCTSINAMIYMRGQTEDYQEWVKEGSDGWSWNECLPYFMKMEDYENGSSEFHNTGGELPVQEKRVSWEILDLFRDAAEENGIPKIDEFNTGNNFGSSYFQMNQRNGVRWNAVRCFLWPIKNRKNLTIYKETTVAKINYLKKNNQNQVESISVINNNLLRKIKVKKELILSAGAIGSPQILQISGIGDHNDLDKIGIQTKVNLPMVGKNLHDHLQLRIQYKVQNVTTLNDLMQSNYEKVKMALQYFIFKKGPMTMPPSQLGVFAKSDPNEDRANIEWHVQPLSLDKFGDPLHKFSAITPSVTNIRPTSRGSVLIKSNDIFEHPKIKLNYLSTEYDAKVAIDSIKVTRKIMSANCLKDYCPEEFNPGKQIQSDEDLFEAAKKIGTTIFHPVGTCKMGKLKDTSVVNSKLMVHEFSNLRVVDASVMPKITSGNTNAPTMMIAERASEFILKDIS